MKETKPNPEKDNKSHEADRELHNQLAAEMLRRLIEAYEKSHERE